MAVVADRVIVELEAKLDRYNANLKRAEQNFARSVGSQQKEIRALEAQIARSSGGISSSLKGLAATFAAAFSIRQIQEYADSYTRLVNQLRVAGVEGENLAQVQGKLLEIANRNGIAVESLGVLFSRGSQVSKELGASQEELIQFSSGVAAALKIQGTSATEAQGALLQLSQALGSGTVRAEEFNSINEGALPILQAVAQNMDAAGGSVAKLKALVNEGKVSSDEFFRAFLAGTEQLEEKAANASLTIGGAFEVLNNQLGVYIGQADDSLSATEKISQAIITLSENLDTVSTALAVLGTVLLGRYVAGAIAAARTTGVVSTAIFAMQARAVGAATTMEALGLASATAGRAMLAAFGGPVGLAVTALALGFGYLATQTESASDKLDRFASEADKAEQEADAMEARLKAAGIKTEDLGGAADGAAGDVDTLTGAMEGARAKAAELENQAARTAIRLAQMALQQNLAERQRITDNRNARQRTIRNQTRTGDALASYGDKTFRATEDKQLAELDREDDALRRKITYLETAPDVATGRNPTPRPTPTPSPSPSPSPARRRTGASDAEREAEEARQKAKRAAQTQAQVENEIAQLAVDRLRSVADLTGSADDRAIAETAALQADREAFDKSLKLDEELTEAQREQLSAARDAADAERERAIAVRRRQQLADEQLDRESAANSLEQDVVSARGAVNDRTARQRLETDLRLIDLQFSEEKAQLDAILASETSTELEKDIARAKLERLDDLKALAEETARLRNQTPFEKFYAELDKSEAEINEDLERIAVDGLESLTDGLTDVITGAKSLEEVFSSMADQIIADLIRIAIQQAILKPLLEAFGLGGAGGGFGGGGGGDIGGFFAGLFGGRASGGHVVGGGMYRVTDGEGFLAPQSGKIVPLGRMRGANGGGGVTVQQTVNVDARGVNPEGFAEHIRESVRQETVKIVREGAKKTLSQVPGRVAQYQRDGT